MLLDLKVSQSIDINAEPSKVWEALTNPDIIKEYLFGTETSTDWEPGSEITFRGTYNGHEYRDKGVVQENIPNEKLSYRYWSGFSGLEDEPENYAMVTYTLHSSDNKTTNFTWTQEGYSSEAGYEHSVSGMAAFLEQIKGIVERE